MFGHEMSGERRGNGWSRQDGKSNNAVAAERRGLVNSSTAVKQLKIAASVFSSNFDPVEWHHAGPYKMRTNYYDISLYLAADSGAAPGRFTAEQLDTARAELEEMRALSREARRASSKIVESVVWPMAKIEWTEFEGSRKRPRPVHFSETSAAFQRGTFVHFVSANGHEIRKKADGNHFRIEGDRVEADAPEFATALDAARASMAKVIESARQRRAEAAKRAEEAAVVSAERAIVANGQAAELNGVADLFRVLVAKRVWGGPGTAASISNDNARRFVLPLLAGPLDDRFYRAATLAGFGKRSRQRLADQIAALISQTPAAK